MAVIIVAIAITWHAGILIAKRSQIRVMGVVIQDAIPVDQGIARVKWRNRGECVFHT
jgi:hypothetical protein